MGILKGFRRWVGRNDVSVFVLARQLGHSFDELVQLSEMPDDVQAARKRANVAMKRSRTIQLEGAEQEFIGGGDVFLFMRNAGGDDPGFDLFRPLCGELWHQS